jgi:hypothetical protein
VRQEQFGPLFQHHLAAQLLNGTEDVGYPPPLDDDIFRQQYPQDTAARVSTLELFFDLVFVFTITQVSDLLLHAHTPVELTRPFLLLALIWWMYGGGSCPIGVRRLFRRPAHPADQGW